MTVPITHIPTRSFRNAFEDAMELHLETEVRDYLNRLWLDDPDSFDVDEHMDEFMDYVQEHFRMCWIYTRD